MGFSDLLGSFSAVALAGTTQPTSGGGLWDWVKTTAGSAWDYAKDLGAAVIERKVMAPPPPPPQAPTPPLIQYWPAPGAGAPRYDWGMGGEVTTQAPIVPIPGLTGMAPLLLLGVAAIFLMKGGK